jgi:negative regulator of sigma E activity
MTTDHAELFSALMDREPVDPDALARALDDPGARRALVAFATVRQALHAPVPGESAWLAGHAARLVASPRRSDRWRLAAAAALLAAGLGAGVVAERMRSQQGPPEPARVVQLDPIPADRQ